MKTETTNRETLAKRDPGSWDIWIDNRGRFSYVANENGRRAGAHPRGYYGTREHIAKIIGEGFNPRMLEGWTETGREALAGLYSPWRPGWVATRPRFYRKRGPACFAVALLDTAGKTGDIVGVFGNRAAAENHAGHQPNRAHYRPAVLPWGELEARRARGWVFYT